MSNTATTDNAVQKHYLECDRMTNSGVPLHTLFTRIVAAIEENGRLTREVLTYIESALFAPDPERLAIFFSDEDDCERDSLLDLIFSPDQNVQIGLEPYLEAFRFTRDDEIAINERLMDHTVDVMIQMPDGEEVARVSVPDYIKSQYLIRLHMTWHLPPPLAATIDNSVSPVLRPVIKVRLRNCGGRLREHHFAFFCRFFQRMDDDSPDYLDCLDLTLPLLENTGDQVDVYELFANQKRSLFRSLQQVKRFERLLGQSNMETLMLQGVRAPQASRRDLLHRMDLIDRICFDIFGKIETIPLPMEELVRQVPDPTDTEAAVRTLLR